MQRFWRQAFAIIRLFACIVSASAESTDLSGMSFDALAALKDKTNLAIWHCAGCQEATVPREVWKAGEAILAGAWTAKCSEASRSCLVDWEILGFQ